jgi:two-component system OmpR family response regulator
MTAAVAAALRGDGFQIREVLDGSAAEAAIEEFLPDLIVLEVDLRVADGLEIARRVRTGHPRTRIIFVTARDSPEDRLAGLAVGDDYVTKPFSVVELVARVRAVLRGTGRGAGEVLRFADVVLDEQAHAVWRRGQLVELTPTEFALLRLFMLNPRRVLSKVQILDRVWSYEVGSHPNIVETYVCYLRKKLDPLGPPLIHTIRLVGYALREPER